MDLTGQRIINLIETKYPSDAAFERALGIPVKTVYDWRRGKSRSYRDQLPDIAKLLETSTAYLLGETDDPEPPDTKNAAPEMEAAVNIDSRVKALSEARQINVLEYLEFLEAQEKRET